MNCYKCNGKLDSDAIETRYHSIIVCRCQDCQDEEIRVVTSQNFDSKFMRLVWKEQFEDLLRTTESELKSEVKRYAENDWWESEK